MTPAEALREAALAGRFNQFELSGHCRQRMNQRNATRRDICCALKSATTAELQDEAAAKWRLDGGCDDGGDPLDIVIIFTGRGLIVTIF